MMKNALVIVIGAGYVGGKVVSLLKEKGWDAVGVSLSGGDGLLACDVSDAESVAKLPDVDWVVHCASSGRGGAEAYQRVYCDGAANLVKRFPQAAILYTSSTSVYSQTEGEWVTEESEAAPERETGELLLKAEQIVLQAGGTVARLAGIYGPRRSAILRKILSGKAVIEEDGRRFVNQIHRDDAASAVIHLLGEASAKGEIFNVSDNTPMSQIDLYVGLAERLGKPIPPSGPRDLNRKRGWTHKAISNEKLRGTGWEPEFPTFFDALADL